MADKIRIGIVGATVTEGGSGFGANAHVPALKALGDYELKAVCTTREETALASKEKFGTDLAFTDMDEMVAHPDIDLVVVVVRAPAHHGLVMKAVNAGKNVFCEWPLGANYAEAVEMAQGVKAKGLRSIVGLQARSDPAIMYARDLVADGYIGEVLGANLSIIGQAQTVRGPGRIFQGQWAAGANPLTIAGGHAVDALLSIVGEFSSVSARVSTRIKTWYTEEGHQPVAVDAPDNVTAAIGLQNGAEVAFHVSNVPFNPGGQRMEIYGSEGTIAIGNAGGGRQVHAAKGRDAMAPMEIPDRYVLVPEGTPRGQAYNVAQAYARYADILSSSNAFDPDFELAVKRHAMIDAIEKSSREGRAVKSSEYGF